jgi:hypothetical protein
MNFDKKSKKVTNFFGVFLHLLLMKATWRYNNFNNEGMKKASKKHLVTWEGDVVMLLMTSALMDNWLFCLWGYSQK